MSFAALQQAVLQEAATRATHVQSRLDAQLKSEEQRLKKAVEIVQREILEHARAEAANQAQQLRQGAVLAARADVLVAKQTALAQVRAAFLAQLLNLDEAAAGQLIAGLMALVPAEDGTCVAGEFHHAAVKKAATKRKVTVAAETIPGEGGFMWRSPRLEMNLTLGQLIDQVLLKHRAAVAATLFA